MALWKISVKFGTNAPCKDKRKRVEIGMFVETSTATTTPPLNQVREQPMLAQLFSSKYGIEIDTNKMNASYFVCERIS